MASPMKQIVIKVPPDEHRAIKTVALENNRTINQQMRHFALADSEVQTRLKSLMKGRGVNRNPYKNQNA